MAAQAEIGKQSAIRGISRHGQKATAAREFDALDVLVDDDESLRDPIGVMLEQEGFRAVQAGDGREGFEMALSLKPALVLWICGCRE